MSNRLAELSLKESDLASAASHYEDALAQATELEAQLANSTRAKIDLATSFVHLGNVQLQQDAISVGQENYRQALAILRPLAQDDAQNIEVHTTLALTLARLGEHEEAAAKAESIRKAAPQSISAHYNAGCCFALCSAAAQAMAAVAESKADSGTLTESYAKRAIDALRQAVKLGFKDAETLAGDHDLTPLAQHPDFQALLASVKGG
jgi:tetratricopeptide (TPR) repeat protein